MPRDSGAWQMSYWVYLNCACCDRPMNVARHAEGGTYAVGGTQEAEIKVTYNYQPEFRRVWEEVGGTLDGEGDGTLGAMLGGKVASTVAEMLDRGVASLGTIRDEDYWKPTPGNAGYALSILAAWAKEHPTAVFRVS